MQQGGVSQLISQRIGSSVANAFTRHWRALYHRHSGLSIVSTRSICRPTEYEHDSSSGEQTGLRYDWFARRTGTQYQYVMVLHLPIGADQRQQTPAYL